MKADELKQLAGGTMLKVAADDGYMAGHGCKFGRVNDPAHTADVIIKGKVHTISVERLEKHGQ